MSVIILKFSLQKTGMLHLMNLELSTSKIKHDFRIQEDLKLLLQFGVFIHLFKINLPKRFF